MDRYFLRMAGALIVVGLLSGSPALGQGASVLTGTVTDTSSRKPLADVVVTATSRNLQGEQLVVTDKTGLYRIPQLPPGVYTLRFEREGYKPLTRSDITLRLDTTTRLNLELLPEALKAEEIVVVGRAPTVDVSSSTTGVNVGTEFVRDIAVVRPGGRGGAARSFESLATVAPGAVADDFGISISGTTSPENQYVIDGLSVNDPGYGLLGTPLTVDFIQEVNVITGGYMPEYGRATGGVLNVITKSGSNEFHGSVFGSYAPGLLEGGRHPVQSEGSVVSTPSRLWNLGDFGAELGGPILKDRLWFYAGVAPSFTRYGIARTINRVLLDDAGNPQLDANGFTRTEPIPGTSRQYFADQRSLQYIAKLTWLLSSDHNVTLSVYGSPTVSGGPGRFGFDNQLDTPEIGGAQAGSPEALQHLYKSGGNDISLKWSSSFLDKRLLFDATAGWHHQTSGQLTPDGSPIGSNQGLDGISHVIWRRASPHSILDFEPDGPQAQVCDPAGTPSAVICPVQNYDSGGPGFLNLAQLERYQLKAVGTLLLQLAGHHLFKVGFDGELLSYHNIRSRSGGVTYRESRSGTSFKEYRQYGFLVGPDQSVLQPAQVALSTSNTLGGFIQDSWSIFDRVTLNIGLRYDAQFLVGDDRRLGLALPNQWSPRVGLIYDFTQQGRSKLFASYARFFESVPLDMVDRGFPGDHRIGATLAASGCDPRFLEQQLNGCRQGGNQLVTGDPWDVNQRYTQTGGDKEPVDPNIKPQSSDEIVLGGEYELVANARVGVSYTRRWLNYAIEDMSRDEGSTYFIGNPGYGFATDFPRARRDYDALTAYFDKSFADLWLAQVSYTYSALRGNISGLYNPQTLQLDPNALSDFDLISLLPNRYGPLPGDHTHQFKVFAAKEFVLGPGFTLNLGASYRLISGQPVNYLGAHPSYGAGEAYILPRGSAGRLPPVHDIDLRAGINYHLDRDRTVTLNVDVFNVFNFQQETLRDENYTFASVQPIPGGTRADLDTRIRYSDGTPFAKSDINPNFNHAIAYQAPRTVRFGAKVSF